MSAHKLAYLPTASADPVANPNWQRLRYTRYASGPVQRIKPLQRRRKWLRSDLEIIDSHITQLKDSIAYQEGYVRGLRGQMAYLSSPEFRGDPIAVQVWAAKIAHSKTQGGTQ